MRAPTDTSRMVRDCTQLHLGRGTKSNPTRSLLRRPSPPPWITPNGLRTMGKYMEDTLRHLVTLHPMSFSTEPLPQFRLFADTEGLCLEGDVDELSLRHLQRALESLPWTAARVLDVTRARHHGKAHRNPAESASQRLGPHPHPGIAHLDPRVLRPSPA